MKLSAKEWQNYITKLSQINKKAAALMQTYIDRNGFDNNGALIDYAYSLVSKYGEASGVLAAEMYDAIAIKSGVNVPPAEVAEPASYQYTAKAINGTMLNEYNTVSSTVGRLVKQVAADTTLRNAQRDGAKFAWIPHGDTCAFCIALASRGWQRMSKKALKNGHAEHIHANCDCEYAISFDKDPVVEGYDPDYYKKIYYGAEGNAPEAKINAIRRAQYAASKGKTAQWDGAKLKAVLGDDYGAFKSLVDNAENKNLYDLFSEEAKYIKDKSGYWQSATNSVHFGYSKAEGQNKYFTLSHENGHMFDEKMGRVAKLSYKEVDLVNSRCTIGSGQYKVVKITPSVSDEFLSALRKDEEALRPRFKDGTLLSGFKETITKRNASAGVQDAVDGFFDTYGKGTWGHGNKYYNRLYNNRVVAFNKEPELKEAYNELGFDASSQAKTKRLSRIYETASEAWANASAAVTCKGDELKYFKEYLPNTYKAYMDIVGGYNG